MVPFQLTNFPAKCSPTPPPSGSSLLLKTSFNLMKSFQVIVPAFLLLPPLIMFMFYQVCNVDTRVNRCFLLGLQRALPIRILTVGKKRSRGVQLLVDEYIEKIGLYCPVDDVRVKSNPKNARDVMAQIEHEDMASMARIRSDEWVIMLDEHGLDVNSEKMASLFGDAMNTGASSLLFCIGGPYGHGRQVRERANLSIKLSSLVLNHEIALIVLMEQIYRTWTILKGQKYHH
ncbi:hypothetical protein M9H77_13447 [Catharanthus roseus]|uniref:Uncharacterized protein n=1 Tax=Catharanthus roseus TaxID=4058 RepID=A0ACC0BKD1_CATRO|nr:hypothetical protein M9H77_13447 [Catharanthus roseus]